MIAFVMRFAIIGLKGRSLALDVMPVLAVLEMCGSDGMTRIRVSQIAQ